MENQLNDGRFLSRIINELDSGLSLLLSKGAIYFDSIGGIAPMPELIRSKVDLLRDQLQMDAAIPRLVAVADSEVSDIDD